MTSIPVARRDALRRWQLLRSRDPDSRVRPRAALALLAGLVALTLTTAVAAAGTLSFAPAANYGVGSYPHSVSVGDVNGDGQADLVTANVSSNNVSVLGGNSDGSFALKATVDLGGNINPYSVAAAKLNGDINFDLAVANINSNNVSVLIAKTDGTFGFQSRVDYGVHTNPTSVAVGYLDNDANLDLVVTNYGSNDVSVLLGDGSGSFHAALGSPFPVCCGPFAVAVGYLNSGSDADLVVANANSNGVAVLLGNGSGSFGAASPYDVGGSPESVAVSDLDGDGHDDVVVGNAASGNVSVLLADTNGDGGLQRPRTDYTVGSGPASVAIANLDGNTTPDLAVANNGSNNVSVLLGAGGGNFTAAGPYGAGNGPYSLAALSPSDDNKPDLVVANAYSNDVSVLLNTTSDATPGSITQTALGGSSITTDTAGVGATADVPVQTQVTLPSDLPATTVSITAQTPPNWLPSGPIFGKQVVIDVGGARAAQSNPFLVSFTLDSSLLGAVLPADVQIFRDGIGLTPCADPKAAIPDACVASQVPVGAGGDAVVTVRTTHFSTWTFARLDYAFGGFLQPVDNLPTVNTMKAGSAVPVKFSLGGNKGLNIFQPNYPAQGTYGCDASPTDQIEQTVTAGGSSLSYDTTSNTYTYVWKTDKSWAASCRELTLKLRDGTTQKASFQLTK